MTCKYDNFSLSTCGNDSAVIALIEIMRFTGTS